MGAVFGSDKRDRVRYGVVGLGYIAQVAVLPAFQHADNSELVALVSGDQTKLNELGEKYEVSELYSYDGFETLLRSGKIDAVFIALPNDMHAEYTMRAAAAGVHVLCEKPMGITEDECRAMIDACQINDVRLMIAYRLHFEEANLKAIEIAHSGKLGEIRYFESAFSMQVRDPNIRTKEDRGGGPLYDIGIYCINAARYIFQSEPTEVIATSATGSDPRFREVEEMVSVTMKFPGERLASFTASFGAADVSAYRVVGTKGDLQVSPAFEYVGKLKHILTVDGKSSETTFKPRDQFAPKLIHFSECVRNGEEPLPSGRQGLADIRIIQAAQRSILNREAVRIEPIIQDEHPNLSYEIRRPAVKKPELVHAQEASRE